MLPGLVKRLSKATLSSSPTKRLLLSFEKLSFDTFDRLKVLYTVCMITSQKVFLRMGYICTLQM